MGTETDGSWDTRTQALIGNWGFGCLLSILSVGLSGTDLGLISQFTLFWSVAFIFLCVCFSFLLYEVIRARGGQTFHIPPVVKFFLLSILLLLLFISDCIFVNKLSEAASGSELKSQFTAAAIFGWFLLIPVGSNARIYLRIHQGVPSDGTPPAPGVVKNPNMNGDNPLTSVAIGSSSTAEPELFTAKYAYTAQDNFELSFPAGALIEVYDKSQSPDWWIGNYNGRQGQVPSNYLTPAPNASNPRRQTYAQQLIGTDHPDLVQYPWFHGKISREDSEGLLLQARYKTGAFLVRESQTSAGSFSLSLKYSDDKVTHFKIEKHSNGKYDVNGAQFDTIAKLVEKYKTEMIISRSGAKTLLLDPVQRKLG
eukprot:Colp12_sorted_trinity150504_noHs@26343